MHRAIIATFCVALATSSVAHEMTPTYPKWTPSYVEGVWKTTLKMFNKRQDVEWYEIGVFDKEWKPINFVSQYRLFKMEYLAHVEFDVYVSSIDVHKAEYVCSKSKLRELSERKSMVSSRICSRFK